MVANVRHLTTGYISPQFHVVFDDLFETVNCIGVNDRVVESICNGLFQCNQELYAEDVLDEAGNIIYQPPLLHEVWLDEAGRRQGNKDRLRQRRQTEDLMRDRNCAVRKSIPPPVATDVDDAGKVPGVAPISDNGSVDSSLFSRDSESEGDIWGNNNYDDDASNAHEGANLVPPNFIGNEGVQPTPNITQAPEGAHQRTCGKAKEYPPAVWRRGADGKMEHVSLSVIRQEYKKLNCDMFALTFGLQEIPPMAQKMSKKQQRLNYKQNHCSIKRSGDMALMSLTLDKTIPTVADLLASPLTKYITLAANDCGYGGKAKELIVTYVNPLFLKAHSAASKADNPSWREAIRVSTWAFKCKRYPDGLIKKLKARFCARGDKQLEGIDFFDTYANDPQDIESLEGEGGLFGRVPGRPQVGAANRSQGQAQWSRPGPRPTLR